MEHLWKLNESSFEDLKNGKKKENIDYMIIREN